MKFLTKKKADYPRLKTRVYPETAWITNFWIIGDSIYFTDADLLKSKSLLAKMPLLELKALLLSNSAGANGKYFTYPHPLHATPEQITTSAMTLERIDEGYLYNLKLIDQQLYRALIRPGDRGGTYVNDQLVHQNIAILGTAKGEMYGKSVVDKRTLILLDPKNHIYKMSKINVKKIVRLARGDVILNTANQIIFCNDIVYSSPNELEITKFGKDALLVSERGVNDLFVLHGDKLLNKKTIWHGNFFYHLIAVDRDLIIGKPFYDHNRKVNFSQPLVFIH